MKYSVLGYFIGEGFSNVFKNKKSTGASLMIMCATMIIFGIFLILGENINHIVKEVEGSQGIQVFLNADATDEQVKELGEKIRNIEVNGTKAVNTVVHKTKEDALNTMKERFGENLSQDVQDQISKFENVKKITSKDQTVTTLINLANGIKIVTGVILLLLIFISVFIIANTIKLTVHARRKEISIMKYVGATNNFIRWPFIVEGMIIGIMASAISIVIVGIVYNIIADNLVNSQFMKLINMSLVSFGDMFNSIIITYMLLGIGIGAFGSIISMRKYLKV